MRQTFIKVISFLFILLAVISIIIGVTDCLPCSTNYIGIASAFGTLAGAILVFSTLEMQRKSLNEEKYKNEIERFDSRFYPILSSFRSDASNMEIKGEFISAKGKGAILYYKGERAFMAARNMINGLNSFLCDISIKGFDKEELESVLHDYNEIAETLYEEFPCMDDIEQNEKERREYIKSIQIPYLAEKMGINKDDRIEYQQKNREARESFLLNKFIEYQSATLGKYIQSLRFILQIINTIESEKERTIYYQHVSCLIGKEESEFLKCFSNYNLITDMLKYISNLGLSINVKEDV